MRQLMVILFIGLGLALSGAGLASAASAPSPATGWKIQHTPDPAGSQFTEFSAVSCASAASCVAVGTHTPGQYAPGSTLAEHWNGRKWAVQAIPTPSGAQQPYLASVSCASPSACTAVGGYQPSITSKFVTLAERWDGRKWWIQRTPRPAGSELTGVSCQSDRSCTAVGSGPRGPLAEHWNGRAWAIQYAPVSSGQLTAVSCVSATSCTAVGSQVGAKGAHLTLAEHWNGRKWRVQATPTPSGPAGSVPSLSGVSCPSASSCTAAGTDVFAYGSSRTLAEHWNGRRWTLLAARNPAGSPDPGLFGVSCTSPASCRAVGDYATDSTDNDVRTLAEHWNGRRWSVQYTPNAVTFGSSGPVSNSLGGISCRRATRWARAACTAVGSYDVSSISNGNQFPLAERN